MAKQPETKKHQAQKTVNRFNRNPSIVLVWRNAQELLPYGLNNVFMAMNLPQIEKSVPLNG